MFDISSALDTDSYKFGHPEMLPPGAQYMASYGEARSDEMFNKSVYFGDQAWYKTLKPVTREDVEYARELAMLHCGVFPYEQWMDIVNRFGGNMPIQIDSLPEGIVVPNHNALYQVRETAPGFAWLGQWVEAAKLRATWYPSTVATLSWHIKHEDIKPFLIKTCDDPENAITFMVHDFGARGVSSRESAALGGMAHLVNFNGSDTLPGILAARNYYGEKLAAFNIPAMEHSTVCAWGRENEAKAYSNAIAKFMRPGKMLSIPPDAYDLRHAVDVILGQELKDQILASGGRLVVRPDSGDPLAEILYALRSLANRFGFETNKKGYDVLHPAVRIIAADGMKRVSVRSVLTAMEINGFSAENVAYGLGGGLLQAVERDDLGYAQKANAVSSGHEGWIGISKDPVTARQKVSKKGLQMVVIEDNKIVTVPDGTFPPERNLLVPAWRDGQQLVEHKFSDVRARSNDMTYVRSGNGRY